MAEQYNPRYVTYAKHQARTVLEQVAWDKQRWPGGCNAGYMLYVRAAINTAREERCGFVWVDRVLDQQAFDNYLEQRGAEFLAHQQREEATA